MFSVWYVARMVPVTRKHRLSGNRLANFTSFQLGIPRTGTSLKFPQASPPIEETTQHVILGFSNPIIYCGPE